MQLQMFNEQSLEFQEKIMERSGLGDETYLPEGQLAMLACTCRGTRSCLQC